MSAGENRRDFTAPPIPRTWTIILALLALAGLIAFLLGISGAQAQRAWQAYLINFVFWTGLSFGAVLFVAVLNMTDAQWGRSLKRLAEALGAFLPGIFPALLGSVLRAGRDLSLGPPAPSGETVLAQPGLYVRPQRSGPFSAYRPFPGPDLLFRERG